ncbi:MAG: hypothetical protein MPJ52_00480 [Alphaproteobacteria bacterium]|nr:hypothetical protein [Alphaproteobacteria bacterium]
MTDNNDDEDKKGGGLSFVGYAGLGLLIYVLAFPFLHSWLEKQDRERHASRNTLGDIYERESVSNPNDPNDFGSQEIRDIVANMESMTAWCERLYPRYEAALSRVNTSIGSFTPPTDSGDISSYNGLLESLEPLRGELDVLSELDINNRKTIPDRIKALNNDEVTLDELEGMIESQVRSRDICAEVGEIDAEVVDRMNFYSDLIDNSY